MDPISLVIVTAAALSSSVIKNIVQSVWEKIVLPKIETGKRKITITSQSGNKIEINATEKMTEKQIDEIITKIM